MEIKKFVNKLFFVCANLDLLTDELAELYYSDPSLIPKDFFSKPCSICSHNIGRFNGFLCIPCIQKQLENDKLLLTDFTDYPILIFTLKKLIKNNDKNQLQSVFNKIQEVIKLFSEKEKSEDITRDDFGYEESDIKELPPWIVPKYQPKCNGCNHNSERYDDICLNCMAYSIYKNQKLFGLDF